MSEGPLEAPEPKAYAHKGRRRRRITDELFRCPCPLVAGGISCGALLWRSDLVDLREHLITDHNVDKARVAALTDDDVAGYYIKAELIPQADINDLEEPDNSESDGVVDYE